MAASKTSLMWCRIVRASLDPVFLFPTLTVQCNNHDVCARSDSEFRQNA